MNNIDIEKIKEKARKTAMNEHVGELITFGKNNQIVNKSFYANYYFHLEKELKDFFPKKNDRVKFVTRINGELVENTGIVLRVTVKDIKEAIFIFDILADDNRDYRVINNQKRYPDDFIEKIEK